MQFTERQRIVFKTNLARDRAETLLRELLDTSRAVQIHNVTQSRPTMNCASSLETAISSARRLVEVLNGALRVSEFDLNDLEMTMVDEFSLIDPPDGPEDVESSDLDGLLRAESLGVFDQVIAGRVGVGFAEERAYELATGEACADESGVHDGFANQGECGDQRVKCPTSSTTSPTPSPTASPTASPAGPTSPTPPIAPTARAAGGSGVSSSLRSGVGSDG